MSNTEPHTGLNFLKKIVMVGLLLVTPSLSAQPVNALMATGNSYEAIFHSSVERLMANLNHPQVTTGAIIASPSQNSPNYFQHWVRDAGLTMLEVVDLYNHELPAKSKLALEKRIFQWIEFEQQLQARAVAGSSLGLGEPLFSIQGDIYPHGWGRPQTDGPGIRAVAMIAFAESLIHQGRIGEANRLYRAEMPANSPIKKDLEYVAHHWAEQAFDVWEEVKGLNFFTQMAHRIALTKGAQLADYFNDPGAARFYRGKAREVESALLAHRSTQRNHIIPTRNQTGGWNNRTEELDVSVVLASLYFSMNDGFFTPEESWMLRTAEKIENTFASLYEINKDKSLAPAIGRYPEDQYDGNGTSEGNAWFLATNAFAEYYCRLAPNKIPRGKQFLDRTLRHIDRNGSMAEQFNRRTGVMQGARDLTWSYASYMRAYLACHPISNTTESLYID